MYVCLRMLMMMMGNDENNDDYDVDGKRGKML